MFRAIAYVLVAILMTCFIVHAIAPVAHGVAVSMRTVARTLRQRN